MFKVLVADNFHYMDEDELHEHGTFATWAEAVAAARAIVDAELAEQAAPGLTADELFDWYTSFGDDPYIVAQGATERAAEQFSAWDYARQRCQQLAAPGGGYPRP